MKTVKYFTATWCGPCQRFKPIMQEVANEGHSVQFIDIDSQEDLARQYNVRSVPTVVIEQNGSEVNRLIGASTKEVILENLS
jgi:thioredoxin 1|tara:strand:+ start:140 stop:385 length:246 start_codon:yes stop_codon:yes gene_type:complete